MERPPLNAFDVDVEKREQVLKILVCIPAMCKESDAQLANFLDETGLCREPSIIKNMEFTSCISNAVLSRYSVISAATQIMKHHLSMS